MSFDIHVRMPNRLLDDLDVLAEQYKSTRSALIREAIIRMLERHQGILQKIKQGNHIPTKIDPIKPTRITKNHVSKRYK